MGGFGGGGGGGGGLDQLLQMIGGGMGGGKSGGGQKGGYDPDAGKSTMDKMDMFGNIADGSRLTPPAKHTGLQQLVQQPINQAQAQAPAPSPTEQARMDGEKGPLSPQDLNNAPPHMGYNDVQGQALDEYAAEELRRRQASMGVA